MSLEFKNDTPIYLQIFEHVKRMIITGEYAPTQKLPSVREFSATFCVNPNTVQKALLELENEKLIYTDRTSGKFVTNDKTVLENVKNDAIRKLTVNFLNEAKLLKISREEVLNIIENEDIL